MYYLPVYPYHDHLCEYWKDSGRGQRESFWDWVEQEYNTKLTLWERPERWQFENEQDMIWFILRWQ